MLPKSSSLADLDTDQLRVALGIRPDALLTEEDALMADQQQSQQNRKGNRRGTRSSRAGAAAGPKPVDLWRPVPKLPDPDPIGVAMDPTVLLQSLGDPPLQGHSTAAEHYLAAAVKGAAQMAEVLATVAGLVAQPEPDEDELPA